MKRRSIMAAATASWLPLPRAKAQARDQAPARQRPARIGWPGSVPITRWPLYAVFTEVMRERGWIEGTQYVVEDASYDGRADRIAEAVAEAVKRKPDLLSAHASAARRCRHGRSTLQRSPRRHRSWRRTAACASVSGLAARFSRSARRMAA